MRTAVSNRNANCRSETTYAENYYGCVAIVLPAQQTPTTNEMSPHAMAPFFSAATSYGYFWDDANARSPSRRARAVSSLADRGNRVADRDSKTVHIDTASTVSTASIADRHRAKSENLEARQTIPQLVQDASADLSLPAAPTCARGTNRHTLFHVFVAFLGGALGTECHVGIVH